MISDGALERFYLNRWERLNGRGYFDDPDDYEYEDEEDEEEEDDE